VLLRDQAGNVQRQPIANGSMLPPKTHHSSAQQVSGALSEPVLVLASGRTYTRPSLDTSHPAT